MTNKEAIKNIREHCYFSNLVPTAREALEIAIKALEQEEAREHMDMLIAHKDKALETHPYFKQCDSCIHSEERDGTNCYECVKCMADNFEAQPTDKCKGCYYDDGETHAECVICDKEAQPTSDDDIIKALKAVRTIHNGNYAPQIDEAIRRLEAQPTSDDCISRAEVKKILGNEVFELMKLHTVNPEDNPKADAMAYGVNWSLNTLMELPSVTPQSKTGYIYINVNKLAKEVAEKALDEITYEGKTVREWVEIIVKQPPCEDCKSREKVRGVLGNDTR